jgi:probable HAF family extracellular repeat protein
MTALPNLKGGNNGQTYWINSQGQLAGVAENGTSDSTCARATPYQVLRFEAVIWSPTGEIQELSPLKGDTVGFAFGINNNGQTIGVSGLCSNTTAPPVSPASGAPHGVLWEKDGSPIDLGNLGGTTFTVPAAINDLGEVAGASQSSKDGNKHAFLWTRETGMWDLGNLPGDVVTAATCCNTINNHDDIVGISCPGPEGSCRAFIWTKQEKVLTDLNTLIPKDSGWYLQAACSINDTGEIVGQGSINGEIHAFLLAPK